MHYITRVSSDADIHGILELQQLNLKKNNTQETIDSQGFVTVEHTFEALKKMNDAAPSIVAKDGDKVVGYAIVMLPEFRYEVPILESLFVNIENTNFENRAISAYNYVVMGQICVGLGYRGIGVVEQMYKHYKNELQSEFEICVTDISSKNLRSKRAHEKVGFKSVASFFDDYAQETWDIVVWDWR